MATIQDITQGASYRGDPALGGAADFGVTINPSPLDRLATYTFYRDRDLWEKKKADDTDAAKQIALISAFDTNSPFIEYTNDLKSKAQKIRDFYRNNPNALYFDRDPKGYQQGHDMIGEFDIARTHATKNDILWNAQKAAIEKEPNAEKRAKKLRLLQMKGEDLFAGGLEQAYRTQLEADADLKAQNYEVPAIPNLEDYTITPKDNEIYIEGLKIADIPKLRAAGQSVYLGLDKPLNINSKEFQALPQREKDRRILEAEITGETRTKLDEQAALATQMIKDYQAQHEGVKATDIPDSELDKDPTIGGFIKLGKGLNQTIAKINAATGQTNDPIDLEDGLDGAEMIMLQTYAKNPDAFFSEIKPQIVQTNAANEKAKIAQEWDRIGLAKTQFDKASYDDLMGADAVLRQVANSLIKGEQEATSEVKIPGLNWMGTDVKGIPKDVFYITDLTALKNFAKIDKDGNQYNVPDAVEYNKKLGQINIVYFKKSSSKGWSGNTTEEIEKDDRGNPIIDKDKTKTIDEREWLANKVKEYFPNKDAGGINSIINNALLENNNSLYEIAQKYKNPGAASQAPDQTRVTSVTTGGGGGGSVSSGNRGGVNTGQGGTSSTLPDGGIDTGYINNPNNVQSQKGNQVTYKDGSVWEIKGTKMKKIK